MGKFHVKLKKQNKLGTGLVSEVSLRTGPFSTGPESGALCTENSYSPSAKITERAFLIQMRTVLWKCKGQEYLHSPMPELASEAVVFFAWFPRKSGVGGKQHSDADVRWHTPNLDWKTIEWFKIYQQPLLLRVPLPSHLGWLQWQF